MQLVGSKVEELLNIPILSTGDMLRAAVSAGTPTGLAAKELMAAGKLVNDEVVLGIIEERIQQPDCEKGFVLDGVPRTVEQAKGIDGVSKKTLQLTKVYCMCSVRFRIMYGYTYPMLL